MTVIGVDLGGTNLRVARLEGMLKMVREMERPAGLQGFGADEAKK